MPRHVTEYKLYQWRYATSYALVGLMVSLILLAAVFYVPGGLRAEEMGMTVASNSISFSSFDPSNVVDLPYKLLQNFGFMLLGISTFSIKLPSLIFGLLSLAGIVILLKHWFQTNVAVISALIIITTSQFIFSSQDGTPGIMYIFLPTWMLLLALRISHKQGKRLFWEILLISILALSLYTPLSIYIIVALISATLLHPHLRFLVGALSRRRLLAASLVGLIILLPLVVAIFKDPSVGLTLLGIPKELPDLLANIRQLADTYFGFIIPNDQESNQSIYLLPSLMFVLLGGIYLLKTRYTARSYIIVAWLILLAPVILFNPSKTTITFVPVMLLIAAGVNELLLTWYRLFPRNPYARVAGLFPIALLVVGMAFTGVERYFYTYHYAPKVASDFSNDLSLLSTELAKLPEKPITLVTSPHERPFYAIVAARSNNLKVLPLGDKIPADEQFMMTRQAFSTHNVKNRRPDKIFTNGKSAKADRLYLYSAIKK